MADLDDFFAKKDRKKLKNKKFSTTDEVAKKLEDISRKTDKLPKKERNAEGDDGGVPEPDQDEWKEFEEEKKDYTGLKIGNLTINALEGNSSNPENSSDLNQGDDGCSDTDKKSGPWKRIDSEVVEAEKKTETVTVTATAPPTSITSNTYVPPHMLRSQQQQQQQLLPSRLRSKIAPDVHNEELFPSLSSSNVEQKKNRSEGSFEMVSHNRSSSHKYAEQTKLSSNQGPKLNLGNRYNTLSNDS